MRPIDSGYDKAAASAAADAEATLDTDTATVGDTISYEEWEALDDMGRDIMRRRLAQRDLALRDNSCDMEVVWLYARDGSWLDPDLDAVDAVEQPDTTTA